MATRNFVPRADGEGNVGTSTKNWLKGWFKSIFVSGNITDGTKNITVAGTSDHIANTLNPHTVTKSQVGLGSVDNTSDINKPISTLQQAALNTKVDENVAITSATKTKITFDSKGLVTAGTNITKTDVGLSNVPNTDFTTAVNANTALSHSVNKDTKLDEGGSNEVSASEIKSHLSIARVEDIGVMGTLGAGVGIMSPIQTGYVEMDGTRDKWSPNYGNYIHFASGSIQVYRPKHYVKITATNGYSIASIYDYANETEANAAGYFLPRMFIDGGQVIRGVLSDKYPHNGIENNIAVSKQGIIPLTSSGAVAGYGFANCTANGQTPANNYGGALAMAKSRGNNFFTSTVFHDFNLMCLYKAHQQACATNDVTYAAWNNVSPYAPKGNNNNALKDVDDTSVVFTTAGNIDYSQRALTGSGSPFAKTTHNGQACGIADLNGNMYRISIGLTSDGTNLYTLKESIAFKDLIDATTGATGAFNVANYDSIGANPSVFTQIGGTAGWEGIGSGANQVFSGETDRTNDAYKVANAGLPLPSGHSAAGTVDFGNDKIYVPTTFPNYLCPLAGLNWPYGSYAGVAGRLLSYNRATSHYGVGAGACLSVL